jgi:prophage antirepressor-like protein
MNTLSLSFEGHQVRFVGTADNPEWVAQDVCLILGIKWDAHNLDNFDEDEKGRVTIPTPGGLQELLTVTEFGFYRLVMKSRKPEAKLFQKWVTSEVLPSIRKYGCYPPPVSSVVDEALTFTLEMLKLAGVSEGLCASFALTQKAKLEPENAPLYEQAKKLLSTQMVVEEVPMSPTELGKAIAQCLNLSYTPSAQKVNEVLQAEGLQVFQLVTDKRGKKRKEWHPTEIGQSYSQVLIDTARGHGKTISRLCWFTSVIPVIKERFS